MKTFLSIAFLTGFLLTGKAQNQNKMETQQDSAAIAELLEQYYFKGIYTGNTTLLAQAFSADALLTGDIKGQPYAKTVKQYMEGVAGRVSPEAAGNTFTPVILSVDVLNTTAMAKLHVKMYDFNYYNFITLQKTNGRWLIVHKTLTHVDE